METLNEALKIAAMDIAVARVPPGLGNGADGVKEGIGGDENSKPGLPPNDSDTASDRSASTVDGNGSEGSEPRKTGADQGRAAPSSSRPPGGRIYVLQDGTFQTQ